MPAIRTYDANGNLTYDGRQDLEIRWNVLNLVSGAETHDDGSLTFSRLSDGTLVARQAVSGGSTIGKRYCGSFVFTTGTGITTPQVESVAWDEGRVFRDSSTGAYRDCWFAGDHLGNVRSVVDISQSLTAPVVLEQNDYLPFGTKVSNSQHAQMGTNRWRYAGKEAFPELNQLDFGARMYDPFTARWTAVDPMAGKYAGMSPFGYCAGNPVNVVDPEGCYLIVIRDGGKDTRYIVCGGQIDNDYNIYECYKNDEGTYSFRSIGLLCSPTSFYDTDTGEWAVGSIIDPNDNSGKGFLTRMKDCDLFDYVDKARDGHEYDFKRTNGTKEIKYSTLKETNRGMPVYESSTGQIIYASARDIGNIAAGLVAGNNGLPWFLARFGFDMYQSYTTSKNNRKLMWESEGMTTQNAQKEGWLRSQEGARYQMSGRLFKHPVR